MTRLLPLAFILAAPAAYGASAVSLASPDRHPGVEVRITPSRTLEYTVRRDGQPVILPSRLGLVLDGADLAWGLELAGASSVKAAGGDYELAVGKKCAIHYRANEQVVTVRNAQGQKLDVALRVSNDGVAFRYIVSAPRRQAVVARQSGNAWYVAGLNADDGDVTLDLDLAFLAGREGRLITDGNGARDFTRGLLRGGRPQLTIKARGGFVARFE